MTILPRAWWPWLAILVGTLAACRHESVAPIAPVVELPSELAYANNRLELEVGAAGHSVVPTIRGTAPISFTLTSAPDNAGNLSIDAQGVIAANTTLAEGSYAVSIVATNAAGATRFPTVFTVVVTRTPRAATNLRYAPDSLVVATGTAGASGAPALDGTTPFTYALTSRPASGLLTIDADGIIHADAALPYGRYAIDVTATNVVGAVTFANAYRVVVQPLAPANLVYSPNSLNLTAGTGAHSAAPTVSGSQPLRFALSSNPAGGLISIDDATGVITASSRLGAGTYPLTVEVTNAGGTVSFPNAFSVVVAVATTPPSNLTYATNSLALTQGSGGASGAPTIQGTTPVTFALTANPAASQLSIDAATGVITAAPGLAVGTYSVTVTATNAAGTATFTNVFTVTVSAPVITFANDVRPLILSRCSNCHTGGGGQRNFTVYATASANINLILDRVQRSPSAQGFMPRGGTPLTAAQIDLLQQWLAQGLQP